MSKLLLFLKFSLNNSFNFIIIMFNIIFIIDYLFYYFINICNVKVTRPIDHMISTHDHLHDLLK